MIDGRIIELCIAELSAAQKAFSKSLIDFQFQTVGTNQTDDERVVATCLKEFGKFINQVEQHYSHLCINVLPLFTYYYILSNSI